MSEPTDHKALRPSNKTSADASWRGKLVRERHWEVIQLLEQHVPVREIAIIAKYSLRTVQYIRQRYHETGLAALDDRRAYSHGTNALLTPSMQRELWHALQAPPPDGGNWTGSKVAQWMTARTGRLIARQRGWEYLGRLRGSSMEDSESLDDRKE